MTEMWIAAFCVVFLLGVLAGLGMTDRGAVAFASDVIIVLVGLALVVCCVIGLCRGWM